jgi:hypothetical protein
MIAVWEAYLPLAGEAQTGPSIILASGKIEDLRSGDLVILA